MYIETLIRRLERPLRSLAHEWRFSDSRADMMVSMTFGAVMALLALAFELTYVAGHSAGLSSCLSAMSRAR